MKKLILCILTLSALGLTNAYADNWDYCYSKEKGLDEACYARKNDEASYYRRRQSDRDGYVDKSYSNQNSYDSNGRFVPIQPVQRQPYILPGMP